MAAACASCGAEQAAGARFCSSCGAPLAQHCPVCGAEQEAGAAFCSACGAALAEGARRATPATQHEERRVVTILFADLAGSTAMGERLDPEDVRAVQAELFELVNGAVERTGGVTEKFVGDAVMAVFGIPLAHEDDAERAVRAALAARDAFPAFAARVRGRHGLDVGLRIGVNTGDVIAGREAAARGELMVSGDAVNVAARLQQRAEPGQVLVGARTHAATQGLVAYREVAAVEAKGKRERVPAWEARATTSQPGLRAQAGVSAPLIGRAAELAILEAVAARVERERVPQLVTVYGQAGIGKSRLLREFLHRLPGARLLHGRCVPYGDGITYLPLAEAAKGFAGILETDARDVAAAKLDSAISSVLSGDAAAVGEALRWTIGLSLPKDGAEVPDARSWLLTAWRRFLAGLGRERLTVLAIEDIHWASESLLDMVASLAETLDDAAVIIACPARPELLDRRPGWGAGSQNATTLSLAPLSVSESSELVAALLEANDLPEEARRRVLERAEGNPFFVEEIVGMWIDSGALVRQNGGWAAGAGLADGPLPDSIHAVIAARLDLLDAASRDALRRCAVVGRIFWPSAVGVDEGVVAALSRRGLVSERSGSTMAGRREFAFKHALTRDVAYAALPRRDRRDLHRAVAEWILDAAPDRQPELAELAAFHYAEAIGYGDDDPEAAGRARALLEAAAEAAIARGAWAEAAGLLRRALELEPDEHQRARLQVTLGQVYLHDNRYEAAREQLEAARTLAESVDARTVVADARAWMSRFHWVTGESEAVLTEANAAIAALEGLPETPQLARVLARRSQWEMLRSQPEAIEHAREAIAVAERVHDGFAEANARTNLMTALANAGVPPDEQDMFHAVELAVRAGALDEAYRAIINFLWSAQAYVPVDALGPLLERGYGLLPAGADLRAPEHFDRYGDLSEAKFVHLHTGRWGEIERAVGDERMQTAHSSYNLLWLDAAAGLALRRGDLESARRLVEEAERRALTVAEVQRIVPMLCLAMPLAALDGDASGLRAGVDTLLAQGETKWTAVFPSLPIVRALAAANEPALLERVARHVEAIAGREALGHAQSTITAAQGLLALAQGSVGAAVERLGDAIAIESRLGRRYWVAGLELDLARAHEAADDADAALDARTRAAAFLEPLGCVNAY